MESANNYSANNNKGSFIVQGSNISLSKEPAHLQFGTATNENNMERSKMEYAFIIMAIDPAISSLDDVQDSIKSVCNELSIVAERVDEQQVNDKITDRIIESIQKANYVICDLSYSRPNIYYEAGYAHGYGKIPIYIAQYNTKLEFDIKDYPVIFYRSLKELRSFLTKRISSLRENK